MVAAGPHTAKVDPDAVRELAKKFIAADFYSMDAVYRAGVTGSAADVLSIDIDGKRNQVEDYVGSWVGMPSVISELEGEVDKISDTKRWIEGDDSSMDALKERYNFKTYEAQAMLERGGAAGARARGWDFLEAGGAAEIRRHPRVTSGTTTGLAQASMREC